jgi:hypothetical protein
MTNVRIPREQQDIALPLVISLSVEMLIEQIAEARGGLLRYYHREAA